MYGYQTGGYRLRAAGERLIASLRRRSTQLPARFVRHPLARALFGGTAALGLSVMLPAFATQGVLHANPAAAKKPRLLAASCKPCAAKRACNPCAARNPCAAKKGCNPCAAKKAGGGCNPCAAKKNPCKPTGSCNPCAAKKRSS